MHKILVIAGEPSGDSLGSKLIKEMKTQFQEIINLNKSHQKELVFQGIGGSKMKNEGLVCLYRVEDLSLMGITEVISSIPKIYSIISSITNYVNAWKPDLIITIDSPDFCFRLVKKIRRIDKYVPIIHYVAPSVWAWRPKRAKKMSVLYDKVLAILPFEKPYFEKYGLSCDFVGHPISKEIILQDNERNKLLNIMSIDNSKRINHTALIDCDLLAKVYINLIDQKEPTLNLINQENHHKDNQAINVKYFKKIIKPSPEEQRIHKDYLSRNLKKNFY